MDNPRVNAKKLGTKFSISREEAQHYLENHVNTSTQPTPNADTSGKKWGIPNRFMEKISLLWEKMTRGNRAYVLLVAIALLLRVAYAIGLSRHPELSFPILDAEYYLDWAKRITSEGPLGTSVFFTEPAYAYLLALLLKLSSNGTQILIAIQLILGSALPIIVGKIGERFFTRPIGIIAGFLAALYGPFLFYDGLLLKTSLETFFLTLFVLIAAHVFQNPSPKKFFFSGAYLGALALLKGNVLILWPLILFVLYKTFWQNKRRFTMLSGIFTAGMMLAICPVTIRNYVVSGDFVPTNYSLGIVTYQGNWWGADGSTAMAPTFFRPHPKYEEIDSRKMAEAYEGRQLKASEISGFWIKKALEETLSDPAHALQTLFAKIAILINYHELSDDYSYGFYTRNIPLLRLLPGFVIIIPFALYGLFLLLFSQKFTASLATRANTDQRIMRHNSLILLGIIGSYLLVQLASNVNSRYRMPIIPLLILLASAALWHMFHTCARKQWRELFVSCSFMAVMLIFIFLPLSIFTSDSDSTAYYQIGYYQLKQKEYASAEASFKQALAVNDKHAWAYSGLFYANLFEGNVDEAEDYAKKLVLLRPDGLENFKNLTLIKKVRATSIADMQKEIRDRFEGNRADSDYDPYLYESSRYLARKDSANAEQQLLKSLERYGNPPASLIALASLKRSQKDTESAKKYLAMAAQHDDYALPARYNLANIYIDENNYPQMTLELRKIYDVLPELGETWYNLAIGYINMKNYTAATPIASAYVDHYKDDPTRKEKVEKLKKFLLQDKSIIK